MEEITHPNSNCRGWCRKLSFSVRRCQIRSWRQSFGWSRKGELYYFVRQRGTQQLCLEKLCVPTQEDLIRSFIAILPKGGVVDKIRMCAGSQVVSSLILMSFSGPFNLASGGFLAAPPLISNCSNLPSGTQGRSKRLESCRQEMGDKNKRPSLHTWVPHKALLSFRVRVTAVWHPRCEDLSRSFKHL